MRTILAHLWRFWMVILAPVLPYFFSFLGIFFRSGKKIIKPVIFLYAFGRLGCFMVWDFGTNSSVKRAKKLTRTRLTLLSPITRPLWI